MSETFDWNALDGNWADANVDNSGSTQEFKSVPDGPYVCVIDKVEFRESKSGNPYLNWVLIVDSGSHEGRWIFKRNMLANAQNMKFLKQDVAACGIDLPDKLSDLKLESFLDRKVKITKKTKNDFENIYIDNLVSETKGSTPVQEFNDDDIPF
tara:strand:- start:1623 stop:2081 length:459 start_codon:yes stop_codon:yes gene_type:complete